MSKSNLRPMGRVAIIGRPNVGKSTLFNALTRSRKSVVRNEPGVTRDIIIEPADWWGREFDVIDTGGITETQDTFSPLIRQQVIQLLGSVDLLVVVLDGKFGLCPEDRDLVRIANESGKPFLLVVNKVDRFQDDELIKSEFYALGHDLLAASFEQRRNVDEIVEWIIRNLPESEASHRKGIRLAIVGKPNVGKSSLCNYLLQENRMLVSDVAGTTVDAVEASFQHGDHDLVIVDTAGLRRQSKRKDGVEYLSAVKSQEAIRRSDVVLLVVDATVGPTEQDAKILEKAVEVNKGFILVANKADLAEEEIPGYRQKFRDQLAREFHFMSDVNLHFISAKTGRGVDKLLDAVVEIYEKLHMRIPTSELNDFFFNTIRKAPAPVYGVSDVKFYYLTQTHQTPPSFICFVNHPEGVNAGYKRFLVKRIQENWNLTGIPIRIFTFKSEGRIDA